MTSPRWTETALAEIKRRWMDGESAGYISNTLSGEAIIDHRQLTRSAVVALADRQGWVREGFTGPTVRHDRRPPKFKAEKPHDPLADIDWPYWAKKRREGLTLPQLHSQIMKTLPPGVELKISRVSRWMQMHGGLVGNEVGELSRRIAGTSLIHTGKRPDHGALDPDAHLRFAPLPPPSGEGVALIDLPENGCKMVVSGAGETARFCGCPCGKAPRGRFQMWCETHRSQAVAKARPLPAGGVALLNRNRVGRKAVARA